MNERALESLEKLEELFRATYENPLNFKHSKSSVGVYFLDGIEKGSLHSRFNDYENKQVREKIEKEHNSPEQQEARLQELGVSKEALKEWSRFDFTSNPPTKKQLLNILENYAKNHEMADTKTKFLEFEKHINKFANFVAVATKEAHDTSHLHHRIAELEAKLESNKKGEAV